MRVKVRSVAAIPVWNCGQNEAILKRGKNNAPKLVVNNTTSAPEIVPPKIKVPPK